MKYWTFILIILLIISVIGGITAVAEQEKNLTNDDILKIQELRHFSLSPDGTRIIYLRTTGTDIAQPEDNGTLMLIDLNTSKEKAISDPSESVSFFALSPDGSRVAYIAMGKVNKRSMLIIRDMTTSIRDVKKDAPDEILNGFTWLDKDNLIFTSSVVQNTGETLPGDVIIMDAIPDPVILKSYSIINGTIDTLTSNNDVIYEYAPSPDGHYIIYKAAQYPESWLTAPTFRYVIHDTSTGIEEEIMALDEGYQDENQLIWSPDSSMVYIERMQNGGINYPVRYTSDIVTYTPATKTKEVVPLHWDKKLLKDLFNDDVEITPFDGGTYVLLADGTNPKLARYSHNGTQWEMNILEGEHQGNIFALETSRDGSMLYYDYTTASIPSQIVAARVEGSTISEPTQLTHLNEELQKKSLGTSEVIEWTGAHGDTIQGVLRYPPGYSPETKYPLVFVIHGGPTYTDFDAWRDTWEFPYHLITNLGVITLSANYHGSSNFGFDFTKAIEGGHYYDLPIEDFMKGKEALASTGIIDPDTVGVTGWSNGGILSLAWVTRDPTLKAAVVGAGTADENSQDAYTNGAVMNRMYYDHTPYEDPKSYIPILGVYRADNVETPVLMLQGTKDKSVVPASAMATYRAYKAASKADVKMILFTDEPHHLTKYTNQVRKVDEELAWLSKII